jgi:class 3 adenylate cyclase
MRGETDVRHVLPAIRVPTLVLHRSGDRLIPPKYGRELAELIPTADYVELPGVDHYPWVGEIEPLVREIERFIRGLSEEAAFDRVLTTLLFTDIVGSTSRAAVIGDREWSKLVSAHHAVVRAHLARFRGREIDTAGDGFLVSFDGPGRAVRCASAILRSVRELGLEVRAGVHTGECQLVGEQLRGIAVHLAARIAARALPGEVLVSSTVKDLVAGSGLRFDDRGLATLKGAPDKWRLDAAITSES